MNLNQIFGSLQKSSQLGGLIQMAQSKMGGIGNALGGTGTTSGTTKATDDYVGELALYVRVMMELMIEKGLVTREEFEQKFNEIDLQDGKADGKLG